MVKVSVIVPIYNVEKYLRKCLDSLVSQTLCSDGLQIILVNDGSRDNSGKIADEFANQYSNFEVYHIANGGVSNARKFGLSKATGKYIGFVDGDDYCAVEMFEKLLTAMETYNLDVVACRNWCFTEENVSKSDFQAAYDNRVLENYDEVFSQMIENVIIDGRESVVLWNKLYRREMFFVPNIDFGHDVLEDYLINMQIFKNTNRFMQMSDCLYYYRLSANSLSRTFDTRLLPTLLEVHQTKLKLFDEELHKKPELAVAAANWFIRYCESILKSLYLYSTPENLDRNKYAVSLLQSPIVKEQAAILLESGAKNRFAINIAKQHINAAVIEMKIKTAAFKFFKKIRG